MKRLVKATLLCLSLVTASIAAAADQTELKWYGHSTFRITTPSGKVLLIDPWITNPANKKSSKEDLAALDKADLILVTHAHFDHIGNATEVARKTGAKLVATVDLAKALVQYTGYPKDQATMDTLGHFGGEISLLDGEVKVAFIPALHGSDVETSEGMPNSGSLQAAGNPGGFLVTIRNGPTFYHTGDTDVFSDMALINQFRKVDVMIACIGDKFTMGPERAALATKLVSPGTVIPMHYGTFPALTGTPEAFDKGLKAQGVNARMLEMKVGETVRF